MKKNIKWIVAIISLLIFLTLATFVLLRQDIFIDSFIYNGISKFIAANLTRNMKCLTYIGSAVLVIGITIFSLVVLKNKRYFLFMSIDLIVITILQLVLKSIFARNRPIEINLIDETGYSFPSGHSLTAMAFYGLIIYFIYVSSLNNKTKKILITLFSLIIFIVGLSRIYLGVHYFTDVVGGFSFSLFYLIIFTSIIKNKIKG